MVTQAFVAPPARASLFLVLTIDEGAEAEVRSALTEVSGLVRSVSFRVPDEELHAVVGIGAGAWDRMFTAPCPAHLHPFVPLDGPVHLAPSTPGDLLVHLRAQAADTCFEFARLLMDRLAGLVHIADEVHGFTYFDNRDLLGFVDGTENPEREAASAAVLVTDDGAYSHGSYVVVQKYLHDMQAWNALSTEEQELVIGRTKLDDRELSADVQPETSHVARAKATDAHGEEISILRDNMPFGSFSDGEFGTYFIGYAKDPGTIETMLERMFLGDAGDTDARETDAGNGGPAEDVSPTTDRILDFSTAVTGSLFYTPPLELLDSIDELAEVSATTEAAAQESTAPEDASPDPAQQVEPDPADTSAGEQDDSLRIGSLRPARTATTEVPHSNEGARS